MPANYRKHICNSTVTTSHLPYMITVARNIPDNNIISISMKSRKHNIIIMISVKFNLVSESHLKYKRVCNTCGS